MVLFLFCFACAAAWCQSSSSRLQHARHAVADVQAYLTTLGKVVRRHASTAQLSSVPKWQQQWKILGFVASA
jgi:hypothetical protein